MGKLDNVKRIVKEDYDPEFHGLIDKLAYVLNAFMEQTTTQMNGNLDFDNLKQDVVTYRVTVDSSGVPTTNNLLRTGITNPRGFRIIRAVSVENPTTVFPTAQPFITSSPGTGGQVVKILHIAGLQANVSFNLTVVAEG